MKKIPDAIFVIDTHMEGLAVREARNMGVPVVGIVDTNADPDPVDHVIPANDDASGSIKLIATYIIDAWIEGKKKLAKGEERMANGKEQKEAEGKEQVANSKGQEANGKGLMANGEPLKQDTKKPEVSKAKIEKSENEKPTVKKAKKSEPAVKKTSTKKTTVKKSVSKKLEKAK